MQPLNRIDPLMSAAAYKTYQIVAPRTTNFRTATCAEVECSAMVNGFKVTVDVGTELGRRQAHYIRNDRTRSASEVRQGNLVEFTFAAGNKCFVKHSVRVDNNPLFFVKDGDYRGNPRGTAPRQHTSASDWLEDFSEHQDKLKTALERG